MPTELSFLTAAARRALTEANAKSASKLKDVKPSEDVPGDSLKAANGFRDAIKGGDALEQSAQDIAKLAQMVAEASEKTDLKRAAMDVESAAVKMKQAVDSIYGPYAEARKAFYSVALAWDMYDPPATTGKKPSSDVKAMSEKELAEQVAFSAKTLQTNVRDFLEKGATASKMFRDASKKLGLEKGEMNDSQKQAVIDAGFAARTASDPLFGRTQGIVRRVSEMLDRVRESEKYEAKSKKLKLELAVEDDPEIGGLEVI